MVCRELSAAAAAAAAAAAGTCKHCVTSYDVMFLTSRTVQSRMLDTAQAWKQTSGDPSGLKQTTI